MDKPVKRLKEGSCLRVLRLGKVSVFEKDYLGSEPGEVELAEDVPIKAFGVDMEEINAGNLVTGENIGKRQGRYGNFRDVGFNDRAEMLEYVISVK